MPVATDPQPPLPLRGFRYYDMVVAGMVAVLLCSNLIGPAKVSVLNLPGIGPLSYGTGNLFFPIGYIFGDVLTEVYGYARARRAIWSGFGAMLFATVMVWVVIHMPASAAEPFNARLQPALALVFGNTWRITLASVIGYWLGDFANAYVMSRLKLLTRGRHLWTRTIGSTVIGQACDSLSFYPIAFYGIWESATLFKVIIFNWSMKVLVEIVLTPVTYAVVGVLKRSEGVDVFDRDTRFNPFTLRD